MDDLLITDMTCAQPPSAWVDDGHVFQRIPAPGPGKWRIVDYGSDRCNGRLITTSRQDADVLSIPLNRTGWHSVSIGLPALHGTLNAVEVRLSGSSSWQYLFTRGQSREELWTLADLTGRALEVRYPASTGSWEGRPGEEGVATIMYVRVKPIDSNSPPVVQGSDRRTLVYINDGFTMFARACNAEKPGAQVVEEALASFADSDWSVCCFCVGGMDMVNYPSQAGTPLCGEGWDFHRSGDRRIQSKLSEMFAAGFDPLKFAIDQAHRQKQRFWTYFRLQGYTWSWPLDHVFRSRFFGEHPECLCVEADGAPISKLSIAFEPVRKHMLEIMRESLERGADGVTLVLVRGWPLVRYEQPVLAHFRQKVGSDMRHLPATDPSVRLVWRDFVEQWLREVRAMLDAFGPTPFVQRRQLSIICGTTLEWNHRYGMDIAYFARQGLFDAIMPYPGGEGEYATVPVDEFAKALDKTGVDLIPSLGYWGDHNISLTDIRRRAEAYYHAGATGLCRWDTDSHLACVGLDDPAFLSRLNREGPEQQTFTLNELSGLRLNPFGPHLSG